MSASLDPELASLAAAAAASGDAPIYELTPEEARRRVREGNKACAGGPALHAVEDVVLPVPDGEIAGRVYRPAAAPTGRTLVYFHGGGWVTGDLDYSDELCRFIAAECACTVVSVAYRLAPEHPYPRPFEDAYGALDRVAGTIAEGGLLAVGGDSAGGNLAAACALRARDAGGPRLACQLLIYPVLDHDFTRPSYRVHADAFPIGVKAMEWFWDQYVPDRAARGASTVSPLRAADLSGLPPAYLVVAGFDPLRDEGLAYAERLRRAGGEATVADHPALAHGFFRFTSLVPAARRAVHELTAGLADLFARAEG